MAGNELEPAEAARRREEWEERKRGLAIGERGVQIGNFAQLMDMAGVIAKSGFAPGDMGVEQVAVAIQTGLEVGVSPMMAVRNMAVIDGRPSWMGKGALAIVRGSGMMEGTPRTRYFGDLDPDKKGLDQYPDDYTCEVTVKRVGDPEPQSFQYSVADAKQARLWGKTTRSGAPTPWVTAPKRMMYWRALGQALDSVFSDVLLGLPVEEVARDYLPEEDRAQRARVVNESDEKAREEAAQPQTEDPLMRLFEKDGPKPPEAPDVGKQKAAEPEPEDAEVVEPRQEPSPPEVPPAQEHARAPDKAQPSLLDDSPPAPPPPSCNHQNGDGTSAIMYEGDPGKDDEPGVGTCTICAETGL